MNKQLWIIVLPLYIGASEVSTHAIDYINLLLPSDSETRQIHNEEDHGNGWLGSDSQKRVLCDQLQAILAAKAEHLIDSTRSEITLEPFEKIIQQLFENDETSAQKELQIISASLPAMPEKIKAAKQEAPQSMTGRLKTGFWHIMKWL